MKYDSLNQAMPKSYTLLKHLGNDKHKRFSPYILGVLLRKRKFKGKHSVAYPPPVHRAPATNPLNGARGTAHSQRKYGSVYWTVFPKEYPKKQALFCNMLKLKVRF